MPAYLDFKLLSLGCLVGLLAVSYPQILSINGLKSIVFGSASTSWAALGRFQQSEPISPNYDPNSKDFSPPAEYLKSPAKKVQAARSPVSHDDCEAPVFFVASTQDPFESESAAVQQMLNEIFQNSKSKAVVLINQGQSNNQLHLTSSSEQLVSAVQNRIREGNLALSTSRDAPTIPSALASRATSSLAIATLEIPEFDDLAATINTGKYLRQLRRTEKIAFIIQSPGLRILQEHHTLLERTLTQYTGGDREEALRPYAEGRKRSPFVAPWGSFLLALTAKLAGRDEAHLLQSSDPVVLYRFGHAEPMSNDQEL